jgi:hypothetical protein
MNLESAPNRALSLFNGLIYAFLLGGGSCDVGSIKSYQRTKK